jgi:lipid-A-disaccharide synthase-like uncharacterized protein
MTHLLTITPEIFWLAVGLAGQAMFFMRFFVQWLASERQKRSVIPDAFWYFSIFGAIALTAYAIYRQDPVFILGQSIGIGIYIRNIWLIRQAKRRDDTVADVTASETPNP